MTSDLAAPVKKGRTAGAYPVCLVRAPRGRCRLRSGSTAPVMPEPTRRRLLEDDRGGQVLGIRARPCYELGRQGGTREPEGGEVRPGASLRRRWVYIDANEKKRLGDSAAKPARADADGSIFKRGDRVGAGSLKHRDRSGRWRTPSFTTTEQGRGRPARASCERRQPTRSPAVDPDITVRLYSERDGLGSSARPSRRRRRRSYDQRSAGPHPARLRVDEGQPRSARSSQVVPGREARARARPGQRAAHPRHGPRDARTPPRTTA